MNEKERLEKIEDIIDPRKRIGSKTFNFNDHYEYVKLTKDDEDFLVAKALTSGNSYAANVLMKYVYTLARVEVQSMVTSMDNYADLIQEGMANVWENLALYNPNLDCTFRTWAHYFIKKTFYKYLASSDFSMCLTTRFLSTYGMAIKLEREWREKYHRSLTVTEIQEKVGVGNKMAIAIWSELKGRIPIENIGVNMPWFSDLNLETPNFNEQQIDIILKAYLNSKEYDILTRYHGLNGKPKESIKDIAASYGVHCSRVYEIFRFAMSKLQNSRAKEKLKELRYNDYISPDNHYMRKLTKR